MHNPACWRNTAVYLLLGISLAGCSGYSVGQRLNALEEQVARLDGSLGATDSRVAQLERGLGAVQAQTAQGYEVRTSKGKATNYVVVPVPPKAAPQAAPVMAPHPAAPVTTGAINAAMLTPATAGQAYPGAPAVAPVVPQADRSVVPVAHSPAGPVVVPAPSRNAGLAVNPATAGTDPITTRPAQAAPQAKAPVPRTPSQPVPVPRPVAPQPAAAPAGDNGLALPPEGGNMPPSPAYQAPSAPHAPAVPPAGAARTPQASASGGYQAALQQIMAGQYEQGRANMQQFLQGNPNSNLGANAHYWIGESYYAQKNYADALTAFKQVCVQYPQHHKTADALLKAGMTYQRLGDPQNAELQFKALVTDFPRSQAAQVARSKGWGR